MKRLLLLVPLLAALLLGTTACSDESDDSAGSPTPTAAETSPPATDSDTSEPDLSSLDAAGAATLAQAREDYVAACVAGTAEIDQENCALVWNCAVNQVGVNVAADPAQAARLDEALATCEASLL